MIPENGFVPLYYKRGRTARFSLRPLRYTLNGMKVVFAILVYFAVKSSFFTAKYAKKNDQFMTG